MEAPRQEISDDPLKVILRNSDGLLTMTGMALAVLTGDEAVAKPMGKIQPGFADCLPELLK